ncbi:hypothetical protein J3R30DRAFT_923322 [Lentinula aciculospora]|uniref:Uncharacterized protein n=1 Tax=Lentinula aciculospora TaxID=153920 RepID=A0A9W9ATP1_9AGAR|nr:hypothetical protein J3R30DRAFT_923322 [Lentinula aciculospora]
MATIFEPYDTPMLDYHPDMDVQMHPNLDPWFHEEANMEAEDTFSLSRASLDRDLVDVEIEMENYLDDSSQNPEYEMVDEVEAANYLVAPELEDIVDMDALHQPSTMNDSTLESSAPVELTTQPLLSPAVKNISGSIDAQTDTVAEAEILSTETPMHIGHTSDESVPVNGTSEFELPVSNTGIDEAVLSEPMPAGISLEESSTHAEEFILDPEHVPNAVMNSAAASDEGGPPNGAIVAHTEAEGLLQTGAGAMHPSTEEEVVELTGVDADILDQVDPVSSDVTESIERPIDHGENEEDNQVTENDPHEISEGVYIDPPPAVLLSFTYLDHSDVSLFNQPPQSDPSSSTTESSGYAVLLSERPTLYYEPLSTVFEALRNDSELSNLADLSRVELVLDAYDLELTISEDNIFTRETSLHDLNVLHDGLDFTGPLRFRLQWVNTRFIDRYRMLQEQIMRLNLADAGEEYNTKELNDNSLQETTDQEHGPDYTEENVEEYQEQDERTNENHPQSEEQTENNTVELLATPTNDADVEPGDEASVLNDGQYSPENEDPEAEESFEVTVLYDDAQELEEQDTEDNGAANLEEPTEFDGAEGYEVPDDAQDPKEPSEGQEEDEHVEVEATQIQEELSQMQEQSYELGKPNLILCSYSLTIARSQNRRTPAIMTTRHL